MGAARTPLGKSLLRRATLEVWQLDVGVRGRWRHGGAGPARGRGGDMRSTWMRHAAAATALAAALALAAPAQATGRARWASPADFVQTLRAWIAGLWEGPGRADRPASQPVWEKAGGCVDP